MITLARAGLNHPHISIAREQRYHPKPVCSDTSKVHLPFFVLCLVHDIARQDYVLPRGAHNPQIGLVSIAALDYSYYALQKHTYVSLLVLAAFK